MSFKTATKPILTQTPLAFDATAASAAVGANTRLVQLCATENCHIEIGLTPAAVVASSMYLPKDQPRVYHIEPGEKVAAIKATTAGTLHITELWQ